LASQNAGLSGFSCWASDIGGYFGQPTEETFNRWIAFGAFSPIMQLHGLGCREPWDFSVKTLETYKFYSHIHLNLFPYIYTYAQIASQTGMPLMRAMSFSFPEDPGIWNQMLEYEYMFGAELLVAPVYFGHVNNWQVYLPAGNWCDFWNGEPLQGGRDHIVKVGMGEIPVFAKAGAIIPLLDGNPDTLLACDNPNIKVANQDLRLQVYNGANGDFKLYDGSRFTWLDQDQSLLIQDVPTPRWISIKKMGSNRLYSLATGPDGQTISLLQGDLTGNPDFIRLWVEIPGKYKVIL
jgi:alpha-glucosidase (family GH31 glycosyl hydrolase)